MFRLNAADKNVATVFNWKWASILVNIANESGNWLFLSSPVSTRCGQRNNVQIGRKIPVDYKHANVCQSGSRFFCTAAACCATSPHSRIHQSSPRAGGIGLCWWRPPTACYFFVSVATAAFTKLHYKHRSRRQRGRSVSGKGVRWRTMNTDSEEKNATSMTPLEAISKHLVFLLVPATTGYSEYKRPVDQLRQKPQCT